MNKILIIDDNKYLKIALSIVLEESGYEPDTADDGETGLKYIKAEKPALVFLDKKLPDYDGITLLKKIKTIDPELPVIMLTAFSEQSYADLAMKSGALAFITKPFDNDEIIGLVKKALTAMEH